MKVETAQENLPQSQAQTRHTAKQIASMVCLLRLL